MDLPTRDRTAPDVAPVPAGEPGVPLAGDGRGAPAPPANGRLTRVHTAAALVAAGLALGLAADVHVRGVSAVPDTARVVIAAVALFAVCGYPGTRLLLPAWPSCSSTPTPPAPTSPSPSTRCR